MYFICLLFLYFSNYFLYNLYCTVLFISAKFYLKYALFCTYYKYYLKMFFFFFCFCLLMIFSFFFIFAFELTTYIHSSSPWLHTQNIANRIKILNKFNFYEKSFLNIILNPLLILIKESLLIVYFKLLNSILFYVWNKTRKKINFHLQI